MGRFCYGSWEIGSCVGGADDLLTIRDYIVDLLVVPLGMEMVEVLPDGLP